MNKRNLLGLTLEAANAQLCGVGFAVQVKTTGCCGRDQRHARVVRVNQTDAGLLLTVVYPPLLRLES